MVVVGLGAYHSGVEFGGEEYTFASGAGIFSHPPKQAEGARFRESIELGYFQGGYRDAQYIVDSLRADFVGNTYHIVFK